MAGFVRKHIAFWDEVILQGYPLRDELISHLRDGVSVYDVLTESSLGPSQALPYNAERFPGSCLPTVFHYRTPTLRTARCSPWSSAGAL